MKNLKEYRIYFLLFYWPLIFPILAKEIKGLQQNSLETLPQELIHHITSFLDYSSFNCLKMTSSFQGKILLERQNKKYLLFCRICISSVSRLLEVKKNPPNLAIY